MRISSKSLQMQWLATITQQQNQLARLQEQIGSGYRINSAVDDPIGAAQVTNFQQGLARLETYDVNSDTAQRRLNLEEASLNEVTDVLNRVRDLALQAGGAATASKDSRQALADEANELLVSLVDIANSQDGEGRYLFAGNRVQTKAFEFLGSQVVYGGDQGVRSQRIADDRLIQENDSGAYVFQAIRNGNGVFSVSANPANTGNMNFTTASVVDSSAWVPDDYRIQFLTDSTYQILNGAGTSIGPVVNYAPGSLISFNGAVVSFEGEPLAGDEFRINSSRNQDVFTTVQRFVAALESDTNNPADRAQYQGRLNATLMDLDQSLEKINSVRSEVGARLNIIDRQRDVNEEVSFQIESSLSNVRDLDYASAISELELRLLSLEAAQKSFAQTQRTSLFNFI